MHFAFVTPGTTRKSLLALNANVFETQKTVLKEQEFEAGSQRLNMDFATNVLLSCLQ